MSPARYAELRGVDTGETIRLVLFALECVPVTRINTEIAGTGHNNGDNLARHG